MALLAALCAVFKAFMSFQFSFAGIKTVEASLAPVPVMLAGIFFGPLAGGMVGFAGETAGFFMGIQVGGYNPLISLGMALFGIIAGLFYIRIKSDPVWKQISLTAVGLICVSAYISLIVWLYYGVPVDVVILSQTVAAGVELPVFALLMITLVKSLRPVVSSRFTGKTKEKD